jgi:DNA-directed RNA polymerase I subunit RPA2
MCIKCGSLVSPYCALGTETYPIGESGETWICKMCNSGHDVKRVSLPYVLRYLVAELASVNIKVNFDIK